ncbi:MAG: PilZ domain-containing protein [Deltaproteobacteria bacterium]|nr:PilZ domain-containing protein [Deltaproteobacteria bacterium]
MEEKKDNQIVSFNGAEKRRYFRIDTTLPFEDISSQDMDSALTPEIDSSPSSDINTKLLNTIKAMDYKLNFIIKYICHEYNIDNLFETKEEKEVNISASGMRFKCEEEHNVGDIIRVNINLPYPYMMLSITSKVVRVEKVEEDSRVHYNIAVNFVSLDEEKQSNLLKYLFDIQRKTFKDTALQPA